MNRNMAKEVGQIQLESQTAREAPASEEVADDQRRADLHIQNVVCEDGLSPEAGFDFDPVGIDSILLPEAPERSPGYVQRLFVHYCHSFVWG